MREAVKPALCRFPWLRHVFADRGYTGDKLSDALALMGKWSSKIIKRSDTPKSLELLPHRWVVDPTFARLGRCCRLAKDRETSPAASPATSIAWAHVASIRTLMLMRRTTEYCCAKEVFESGSKLERGAMAHRTLLVFTLPSHLHPWVVVSRQAFFRGRGRILLGSKVYPCAIVSVFDVTGSSPAMMRADIVDQGSENQRAGSSEITVVPSARPSVSMTSWWRKKRVSTVE